MTTSSHRDVRLSLRRAIRPWPNISVGKSSHRFVRISAVDALVQGLASAAGQLEKTQLLQHGQWAHGHLKYSWRPTIRNGRLQRQLSIVLKLYVLLKDNHLIPLNRLMQNSM